MTASDVLLAGQLMILAFQLFLTAKMHFFEKSRSKPYFSIKSNYPTHPDLKNRFKYHHDLSESLCFSAKGDSPVYVCGSSLYVNGICKDPDCIPYRTFYDPDSDYSSLEVPLGLSKQELSKEKVEVTLFLKLQNQNQYKYMQTFRMVFAKDETTNSDLWFLEKYNSNITKGNQK